MLRNAIREVPFSNSNPPLLHSPPAVLEARKHYVLLYILPYYLTYLRGSQNPLKSQLLWRSKTTSTNTFFFFIFIFIIIIIIFFFFFFFFLCG